MERMPSQRRASSATARWRLARSARVLKTFEVMELGRLARRCAALLALACIAWPATAVAKPPRVAKVAPAPPPKGAKTPAPTPAPPAPILLVAPKPAAAAAPPTGDPSLDAYRAKMIANVAAAGRISTAMTTLARRAPPRGLPADQKKPWDAQSKLLAISAARFTAIRAKMETVLAKPKPSASELAQTNFELSQISDAVAEESRKLTDGAAALKERHAAIVAALKI